MKGSSRKSCDRGAGQRRGGESESLNEGQLPKELRQEWVQGITTRDEEAASMKGSSRKSCDLVPNVGALVWIMPQ